MLHGFVLHLVQKQSIYHMLFERHTDFSPSNLNFSWLSSAVNVQFKVIS